MSPNRRRYCLYFPSPANVPAIQHTARANGLTVIGWGSPGKWHGLAVYGMPYQFKAAERAWRESGQIFDRFSHGADPAPYRLPVSDWADQPGKNTPRHAAPHFEYGRFKRYLTLKQGITPAMALVMARESGLRIITYRTQRGVTAIGLYGRACDVQVTEGLWRNIAGEISRTAQPGYPHIEIRVTPSNWIDDEPVPTLSKPP